MSIIKNEDNVLIGSRIKKLRIERKCTQPELFRKVKNYLTSIGDNSYCGYDDEIGKQTLSQIETGARGVKPNILRAYATVLNTSIDYLMGLSDDWKHEYKEVKDVLGLSDESVSKIEILNTSNKGLSLSLDELINNDYFNDLIYAITEYKELKNKIVLENSTHIINKIEDIQKFRLFDEYKKSDFIQLKPEEALFLSEYKINSIFNKLTNNMLNNGDK